MKQLSILFMLFTLGVSSNYATNSLQTTNISWGHHGCDCSSVQYKMQKYQRYAMMCQQGNRHACEKKQQKDMEGKPQKYQQCMQMCQGGRRW